MKNFRCECGGELQLVEEVSGSFTYKVDREGIVDWLDKEFYGDSFTNLECLDCQRVYDYDIDYSSDAKERVFMV